MSDTEKFAAVRDALAPRMAERNAGFWCPDGWLDLVVEADARLAAVDPGYRIVQVKEKFGGLCLYVSWSDDAPVDELRGIVREFEDRAYGVCQNCGSTENVGSFDSGWVATLCAACGESATRWQERGY